MRKSKSKIFELDQLHQQVALWKAAGEKVVFTNGCFDLLHPGHTLYLEEARSLGDRLVVGLNSDSSVSQLKGPSRPIVHQDARALVMAALESVDAIVFFEDETPIQLITSISPHILVKGGDYEISNIVGADYVISLGGRVLTIPFVDGFSTSAIEKKIRNN